MSEPTEAEVEAATRAIQDFNYDMPFQEAEDIARSALTAAAKIRAERISSFQARVQSQGMPVLVPLAERKTGGTTLFVDRDIVLKDDVLGQLCDIMPEPKDN